MHTYQRAKALMSCMLMLMLMLVTAHAFSVTLSFYGNILCFIKPENHRGQRMWHRYTYDDKYHSLVTKVEDAYGYSSSTNSMARNLTKKLACITTVHAICSQWQA